MIRKFLCIIFIFFAQSKCNTHQRNLLVKNEDVLKKLYNIIENLYNEQISDSKIEIIKDPQSEDKVKENFKFTFKQKQGIYIEAKQNVIRPKTIDLFLINPIQEIKLELSHFDLDSAADQNLIKKKYLVQFLKQIQEFDIDTQDMLKSCKNIIKELMDDQFQEIQKKQNQKDNSKIEMNFERRGQTQTKEKKMQKNLQISLSIEEQKILKIQSSFFSSSLEIFVPTIQFVKSALSPMILKIKQNFQRYLDFNGYNEQRPDIIYNLDLTSIIKSCKKALTNKENFQFQVFLVDPLDNSNQYKDVTLSVIQDNGNDSKNDTQNFENFQVDQDDKFIVKGYITFKKSNDSNFADENDHIQFEVIYYYMKQFFLLNVKIRNQSSDLKQKDLEFSLTLLEQSIYDLKAVSESFWDKIINLQLMQHYPTEFQNIKLFHNSKQLLNDNY